MDIVTTRRFDVSGAEIPRVAKHAFISVFARYEDFSGGPGFRHLFTAFIVHYFGGILAWSAVRFEHRWIRLIASLKKRFTRH